jgi:3',5'-cyclic AMP phosphodiesterase CpdA
MILAHITDLHFPVKDDDLLAKAIGMLEFYRPDLIICTGDVVSRAPLQDMHKGMDQALTFKRCLKAPVLSVPGNHDLYDIDYRYTEEVYRRWSDEFEFDLLTDRVALHGINSGFQDNADDFSPMPALKDVLGKIRRGDVSESQVVGLKKRLQGDGDRAKIVCLHHHLVPVFNRVYRNSYNTDIVGLAAEVNETLREQRVGLVLSGHKHSPELNTLNGTVHLVGGSLFSPLPRGFENTFNLISVGKDGIYGICSIGVHSGEETNLISFPSRVV